MSYVTPTIQTPQQPIGTTWDHNERAILYVFSPRDIPYQVRRPHQYRFGMDFQDDVNRLVQENIASGIRNNYENSIMPGYLSANRAIIPHSHGFGFDTRSHSERWSFILIVDNDSPRSRTSPIRLKNRNYYWGFFHDEPVNPHHVWGKTSFNPSAILSITHATELDVHEEHDAYGLRQEVSPNRDIDVLSPGEIIYNSHDTSYLITPNAAIQSSVDAGSGQMITAPVAAHLGNVPHNVLLPSSLRSPKNHLQKIVSGLINTTNSLIHKNALSREDRTIRVLTDSNTVNMSMAMNVGSKIAERGIGPDLSRLHTLQDLKMLYPSLVMERIDLDRGINADVADQREITPTQIFSSLITSALPPLMYRWGIADLQFHYVSYMPTIFASEKRSNMELIHATGYMQESVETLAYRWQCLMETLETHLFPCIRDNACEFEVMVSCQNAGACVVQLQLLDNAPVHDWVISQNLLGGLTTPLVADEAVLTNNSREISNLTHAITAVQRF